MVAAGGALLALVGCTGVSQLTADDTARAIAISRAVGDEPAAVCFAGFHDLAIAVGEPVDMSGNSGGGLAVKIAIVRGVHTVLRDDCGALSADFLANVLHGAAGPLAGLLP